MIGLTDLLGRMSMRTASMAAAGFLSLSLCTAGAQAETRVLKLYNLHTKEKVSIAYKKNGRYIASGLKDLNWFLRDWRKKQPTKMDTRLLDLIWESYRQSGSRDYIHVVCGFRSPATNSMLRSRSSGVAKESQHTLGRAMDFYVPDVPLKKMREIGLRMEVGGVGYYPKSGSPFVHFDIGNARHWPRMSRKELVAVFPKGNTIHVPSDGKPLPGYQQALASYKQRKGASAVVTRGGDSESRGGGKTLLAAIFGGGADEEDDVADVEVAAKAASKPEPVKKAEPKPEPDVAVAALAPTPKPKLLAAGVPLPIRDTFDTSAPIPAVGVGGKPADEPAAETEVAALEVSRIPLPQWAPQRAVAAPVAPTPGDEVSALVAAMEASPSAKAIAADAPAQMAYAVPMPRSRPPFETVLNIEPITTGSIDAVKRIAAVEPAPAIAPLPDAAAPAGTLPARALSVVPSGRPIATASMTGLPAKAHRENLLIASSQPAKRRPAPVVASLASDPVPVGKTGRFVRGGVAPAKRESAPNAQLIQSRIEMAAIVSDPDERAATAVMRKPKADALVRDIPTSVFTAGFAAAPSAAAASDSFSGAAIRFLPVAKFD